MEVCDHRKYSTTSISTNNFVVGIWVRKFSFWNLGPEIFILEFRSWFDSDFIRGSIPTLSGVRFRFYPGFDSDFIRGSIPTLSGVRFRLYPGFDSDFIRGSTHTVHCTPASSSSVLTGSATTRPQGSGRVITCRYVLSALFVQPSLPASLQFLCISPQGHTYRSCEAYL